MTEGRVEIVKIEQVEKHPDADTLSICKVYGGYPCIFRTGDYEEGDTAIYVPVDSIVNLEEERFSFLKNARIKAIRLRGVYSMGLLVPNTEGFELGEDVTEKLGITRWQPKMSVQRRGNSQAEPDPGYMIHYDLDGLLRYKDYFKDGEEVVMTEKLEGENARFLYHSGDERLYVASHGRYKKLDEDNPDQWWQTAIRYELDQKLHLFPDIAVYGEIYGHNSKFPYGHNAKDDISLAVFDLLDVKTRQWYDYDDLVRVTKEIGLPLVNELYRGPWKSSWTVDDLMEWADGPSTMPNTDHIREGMVVRPIVNRYEHCGRLVLKLKGESYTTQKKSERGKGKRAIANVITQAEIEKEMDKMA